MDGARSRARDGATPAITGQKIIPAHEEAKIWTTRRSRTYRSTSFSLFLVGFVTFSLLYCVQPILPELARSFHVGVTGSSLALSLTTGCLAVSIFCSGAAAESLGRKGIMFFSMMSAAILNILAALMPSWPLFLAARALEGVVLGGVPAVAMAYLSEEIHPEDLGYAMGLYVGGTAFGGMFGRVAVGILTGLATWPTALALLGCVDLLAAVAFGIFLPSSRNFIRKDSFDIRYHASAWITHVSHVRLALLFGMGSLAMGVFVTLFNYIDFRLSTPLFSLSPPEISFIFLSYVCGMIASPVAGSVADKIGRGPVMIAGIAMTALGMGLTSSALLPAIIFGIVVFTTGFFTIHSVASGWVGRLALENKGHASSLYLLCYYLGSSVFGSLGGLFWTRGGWPSVILYAAGLLAVAGLFSLFLTRYEKTSCSAGRRHAD
ncbi:MFS transporter [Gluconacetobacter azotocaptans]|uniref:MFS transporter n=1 Tax=Gluconacetobacter azotocaptans TaxID=142834 RepID=A0A7W4JT68_9PROT|nr:MFS transporter [Gluconacetobacter azotocaptans]MBB2190466.1 MFS transporter [Gluconacetobacter azotocaptans]GBQ28830.1 major facilitator superfamily transporter [Gluconacetobacter azotocaptans DSM 13594]